MEEGDHAFSAKSVPTKRRFVDPESADELRVTFLGKGIPKRHLGEFQMCY